MKPEKHVFVCMNRRPEGHPKSSCQNNGSGAIFDAFSMQLEQNGLSGKIFLTGTFCMGPCDQGPVVVVYPDGVWYGRVSAQDVPELIESHLKNNMPVERLRLM